MAKQWVLKNMGNQNQRSLIALKNCKVAQSLEEGHKFKTTHGNKFYLRQENIVREVVMRKIISIIQGQGEQERKTILKHQ